MRKLLCAFIFANRSLGSNAHPCYVVALILSFGACMDQKEQGPTGSLSEGVILRVRMRRGLLNRIKAIVKRDRATLQESWNMSDGVREVLLAWVDQREREFEMIDAAQFSGAPPDRGSRKATGTIRS